MAKRRRTRRRSYSYEPSRSSGNGAILLFLLVVALFVWLWSSAKADRGINDKFKFGVNIPNPFASLAGIFNDPTDTSKYTQPGYYQMRPITNRPGSYADSGFNFGFAPNYSF